MSDELRIDCGESGGIRRTGPFSPSLPLSVRKQVALLKNMDSPSADDGGMSSGASTPTRKRLPMVQRKNDKGETFLHIYARRGDTTEALKIIQQGANLNEQDNAGWTPLHEACGNNQYATAELLISYGANVNLSSTGTGDTPLHDACAVKNPQLIDLLLRKSADRNIRNRKGALAIELLTEDDVECLKIFETVMATSSSSSSSSSTSSVISTNSDRDDEEIEDEDNGTPVPACRSSALISSEQPKDEEELESSSVSPEGKDATFTLNSSRRGVSTRPRRAVREKAPVRQIRKTRVPRAAGPTRRGAPRNASKRGGATAAGGYYADESALQRTNISNSAVVASLSSTTTAVSSSAPISARFLGKKFEEMTTEDSSKKRKNEDVYEFRDDEDEEMPLVRFDTPSTSSSSANQNPLKRKFDETEESRKVPPIRISLKVTEKVAEIDEQKKEESPIVEDKAEVEQNATVEKEEKIEDIPTTSAAVPAEETSSGYGTRKNRGRPYKKQALATKPEDKRVTRSKVRQAPEETQEEVQRSVRNRLSSVRISTSSAPAPGPKPATATVLTEGVKASHIMSPKSSVDLKSPPFSPSSTKPRFKQVVKHIYQGNPERTYFTLKHYTLKKYQYEQEKRKSVPPRPIIMKEREYLSYFEAKDTRFWKYILADKPEPRIMSEDCPVEMRELWKIIDEEQYKLLNEWRIEKIRMKITIQRRNVQTRDDRWRHEHGDYTLRPTLLTPLYRSYDAGMLEKAERDREVPTVAEMEKWTEEQVEQVRKRQFCVARVMYNKHKTLWEMDSKRFRIHKSFYRKRLNEFVPNLVELVTPLDPDL